MRRVASPMDADLAANTSEEEEDDMNFSFTSAAGSGTQYITTGGGQVAKLQQNVNNGATLQQMVSVMGEGGVQYVRTLDGGAAITTQPQLITLPIQLPGSKPGDPQQTVQIQVLSPSMLQQQQQPKYQMQIPIQGLQGFQQGGAVLTVAYTPEGSDGSIMMNALPDGLQLVTLPQMVQQQDTKEQLQQALQQQQISGLQFLSQQQQIIINRDDGKLNNNNNNIDHVIIKQECEGNNDDDDDESSQGTDNTETWQLANNQDIMAYINKMPQTNSQPSLPVNLQQFLRLNPVEPRGADPPAIEIEVCRADDDANKDEEMIDDDLTAYGTEVLRIKKKKKYKKKPPKPAKPKPGQVIISVASDGSPVYCCPECELAYPELEQLEQHLGVHKIERRFICGICGAGLKRKEHLERHKLGHNPDRPYVCAVCRKGFKRREHLNLHTVIHSGVKTELCLECGKGFYRKDHLRKHTRSHESRRARDDALGDAAPRHDVKQEMAAITIHVPTSGSCQVPVQINIPQHVVTSLAGAGAGAGAQAQGLDALLAQHA